jgi:protein-S-isoprenylcysteine O-methyltransferase Ste14
MIVFPLQWLAVLAAPRSLAGRTGHPAELRKDPKGEVMGRLGGITWVGATLYSVFLPLQIGTAWFVAGLGAFVAGVIVLILATSSVARTAPDAPFTGGIYRLSRHPMYLSMILVYAGVTVAAASWLFLLITFLTFFLQRFQIMREEDYCLEKYGDAYRAYMNRTRRWL